MLFFKKEKSRLHKTGEGKQFLSQSLNRILVSILAV